jgi:predicted RNase H-like nuclease (RuvC/YqgF family)
MPERSRHDQEFLDLPEDELSSEHLGDQVQKAQEQLLSLKRQQEAIERQKRELEELSRRQDQLHAGRSEMVEKFTRAMVVLERETYDAQKRVELLHGIHDTFNAHLQYLESINPKAWEGLDINKELTKALGAVDDARAEYAKSLPRISPESDTDHGGDPVAVSAGYQVEYGAAPEKDFVYWLKAGFAFTLPLFVVGVALVFLLVSLLTP